MKKHDLEEVIEDRNEVINELIEEIKLQKDQRIERCKSYSLAEIFFLVLCAQINECESFRAYELYGKEKLDSILKRYLPYEDGAPSRSTIARVLGMFDPTELEKIFAGWVQKIVKQNIPSQAEGTELQVIAVDGKKHRGSQDSLCLVSAYDVTGGLTLAQQAVPEKSNEIAAIKPILSMLLLTSKHVVSVDAIGCQKEIATATRERGGHYFLAVKKNQLKLFEQIEEYFNSLRCRKTCASITRSNKGHGRIETRTCYVSQEIDWIEGKRDWKDLAAIVMIQSQRTIKGKTTIEKRYFITSSDADPATLLTASRAHWGIENTHHWVLDVVFHEDRILWDRTIAHNEAIIRRVALNLLRNYRNIRPRRSERSERISIKLLRKLLFIADREMIQLLNGATL
jgi:predicted transposase YbfD/YdcC